ncbi:MAG: Gfo/Idh/MocA family oxidoreductase [Oscillospiraceae bacterium]
MKVYGVVLIGCGHIGEEHIQDIYYRDNIKIVATVDVDEQRAKLFSKKYGAKSYGTDYHAFIKLEEVDIVIIATYADTHLDIMKDCLKAHKHILCEKPITKSLQEGKEFCNLVNQSDSKVLVAHVLRHNETYLKVKELIDSNIIGKLRMIRMVQNHNALDWDRYKRLLEDCTPIIDCGVHYIDIAQWFNNSKVQEVSGNGLLLDDDAPCAYNYGFITMKLENGCYASYEAGWSKNLASSNVKEFIGEKGRISLVLQACRESHKEEGDLIQIYLSETKEYLSVNMRSKYKNMYGQIEALISMIEDNSPGFPTMDDVYDAFKIAHAADYAILNNKTVKVREF